jgi:hypothetical protein
MLSACASAGTAHLPFGFPATGPSSGFVGGPPEVPPDVIVPDVPPDVMLPEVPLEEGSPLVPLVPLEPFELASSLEQPTNAAPPATVTTSTQQACSFPM